MGLSVKKEKIKTWIEALESGRYKQTRNIMYDTTDGPSYCCLGVLCKTLKLDVSLRLDNNYQICRDLLTPEIQGDCIIANDGLDCTFEEIALTLRGHWDIWN